MPDGLLLLAFALTLVANAVLIIVAIRAMRPGGALSDQPRPRERDRSAGAPLREPTPAESNPPSTPATPNENAVRVDGVDAPAPRVAAVDATTAERTEPAAVDAGTTDRPRKTPTRRRRTEKASASAADAPATTREPNRRRNGAASTGNGRRRRFSLPPLDEDSEKVSRSIETFLSGGDATTDSTTPDAESDDDVPPTTVALVAVTDATEASASRNGHEPTPDVEERPTDQDRRRDPTTREALAAVERSLRSAARGTDRIDVQEAGRFRVVLAAAGELAARAYLRRVRASVEPLLEDLDPPQRLSVATATVLGDPLVEADELAERRLATAIEADDRDHRRDDDRVEEPRASGD